MVTEPSLSALADLRLAPDAVNNIGSLGHALLTVPNARADPSQPKGASDNEIRSGSGVVVVAGRTVGGGGTGAVAAATVPTVITGRVAAAPRVVVVVSRVWPADPVARGKAPGVADPVEDVLTLVGGDVWRGGELRPVRDTAEVLGGVATTSLMVWRPQPEATISTAITETNVVVECERHRRSGC